MSHGPSIGYAQDNFGRGLFGGTTRLLSDLLGNNRLAFTAQVNGRLQDAIIYAGYTNLAGKLQYNTAISQYPYFFFNGQTVDQVPTPGHLPGNADACAVRPARCRHSRHCFRATGSSDSNSGSGCRTSAAPSCTWRGNSTASARARSSRSSMTRTVGSLTFVQPKAAFVSDNTLNGYTAPIMGRRMRFAYEPTFGSRQWHEFSADYRRYDPILFNFLTVATRFTSVVRTGRDESFFPNYIGNPNSLMWLRGYDRVNALDFGCQPSIGASGGCSNTELLGSRAFVASAELRFPLIRRFELGVLPIQLPPVDGAVFYDAGMAYSSGQTASLSRPANYNSANQRFLLRSYGYSIRLNLFNFALLRWDYAIPLDRPERKGFWQWSLGTSY